MARRPPRKRDPFTNERPGPLELLARMLVKGGYHVPIGGGSRKATFDNIDIAAAFGMVQNRLGRAVAMLAATGGTPPEIARAADLAFPRARDAIANAPRTVLDLRRAEDRWRLRMIVFDVLKEIAEPEKRRSLAVLAKATKMRRSAYTIAHHAVMAELKQEMNNAGGELVTRLFGSGQIRPTQDEIEALPEEAASALRELLATRPSPKRSA